MCYVKFFCSLKTHTLLSKHHFWAIYDDQTAEVTPNDGLVRESPQNGLIILVKDL